MDALRVSGLLQAQEQAGHQADPRPQPHTPPTSTPAQRQSTHRLEARRAPNAITESMSTSAKRRTISASTEAVNATAERKNSTAGNIDLWKPMSSA